MKAVKFLTIFCLVLIFNIFSVADSFGQNTEVKPIDQRKPIEQPVVKPDTNLENQLTKPQTNERYRIGFQDTLDIQVFRHPELSQVVNVSPDGTILMPRIDKPIIAVCRTERELGVIVGTLYKNYLKNPFVQVRSVEQRSQPFAVIGAVQKPGSYYFNRKVRLLELLAFAGGQDVETAGAKIQVARLGNLAGCAETADTGNEDDQVAFFTYRIKDVVTGKVNPWMQPGDIVSVMDAEEVYVVGNVKEPTKIPLKDTVTLTQAIAAAGGLAPEAKTSKVKIQRREGDGVEKTELVFDLKEINSKKIPDPVLQANDIVEVPKDTLKSVRNGILRVITSGLGNIFYRIP